MTVEEINKLKAEAETKIADILKNLVTEVKPKGIETQLYVTVNPTTHVNVFSFEITLKY